MHFIIANIPESFHTPDLRNFFSELLEKEAFTCFHFRHRPQSHLLNILKNSSHISSADKTPRNEVVNGELGHSDSCHNLKSAQIRRDSNSKISHTQTLEWKDDDECSEGILVERTKGSESENNATLKSNIETEGGGEASDCSKTHWLSSGLAGLASLISEKKRQVKPCDKWSHSTKEIPNKTSTGTKVIQDAAKGDSSSEGRNATREQSSSLVEVLSPLQEEKTSKRTCCMVDIKDSLEEIFMRKYDRKHWLSRSGDILPLRCYLFRVDFKGSSEGGANEDYKTRQELSALSMVSSRPQELFEFQPPPLMPQGNVGTPTHHFRELIRTCQMPGTLIKKLGLEFPRGRGKRRFGQVPFDYGTKVVAGQESSDGQRETDIVFTATGHLIPESVDFEEQRKRKKKRTLSKGPRMELEKEEEDGAEVEEWERYEPFHEDVTSQNRIKERRFEEELEVVWEKGGSGLVFYTDAQFWRAQQGDFDEQTADEWDVDMSVYYEEGAGDKDARDSVDMSNSDKLRSGCLAPSVFKRTKEKEEASTRGKRRKGRRKIGPTPPPTIGKFEAHTLGFGRRLMEAQGWQDGQGLGAGSVGMPYALEGDGQHPHNRKGFGYHGEKLQDWTSLPPSTTMKSRPPHRHHRISTIFDRAEDADPPAPPLRTPEPTTLTHRPH